MKSVERTEKDEKTRFIPGFIPYLPWAGLIAFLP